uniref:Uncharacterized protein n=1 Tax=Romanomermis culicivorax TaxID=13658 RepID=A0A915KXL1_ROMCU
MVPNRRGHNEGLRNANRYKTSTKTKPEAGVASGDNRKLPKKAIKKWQIKIKGISRCTVGWMRKNGEVVNHHPGNHPNDDHCGHGHHDANCSRIFSHDCWLFGQLDSCGCQLCSYDGSKGDKGFMLGHGVGKGIIIGWSETCSMEPTVVAANDA